MRWLRDYFAKRRRQRGIIPNSEFEYLMALLGFGWTPETEDWELIYANGDRVSEFIELYESAQLSESQRFSLMALILHSLDKAYESAHDSSEETKRVERILLEEPELHEYHLDYWADEGKPIVFKITPFMRETKSRIQGGQHR